MLSQGFCEHPIPRAHRVRPGWERQSSEVGWSPTASLCQLEFNTKGPHRWDEVIDLEVGAQPASPR